MRKEKTTSNRAKDEDCLTQSKPNDFSTALVETSFETSFFYTNDKFINQLDNNEIFAAIQAKYSGIDETNEDAAIKKQILLMLDDNDFVEQILSFFNLTVYDLFKMLSNKFGSLFKGPYLKRVKSTIDGKKYLSATRKKHDY